MRQNLRREDDSRLRAVAKFQDYFQAVISRYGVGSYYALNKLGDEFCTRSKKSGVTTVTRVERRKMSGYKCPCYLDMNVQSLQSEIGNESVQLDGGTEIKVLKLHPDLIHLLQGAGHETLCKNLKAVYYSYLGVETSSQIQGSPSCRSPGFLYFEQTMKRCLVEGVWGMPKGGVGSRAGGLDMLTKLQNAFTSPGVVHPTIRPTDIKIKCRKNGNLQEFELSNVDCFLDSICKNAKDCFPLHFSIDIKGTQTVVMGAVFYFPILNGEETCPGHDEFLEQQMNTQKLIVFWEGRLLLSAAGNLMPAFLKPGKGSMIPDRVHRRIFTVLYVDSAFQPDYNKRNLSSGEALRSLEHQFAKSKYAKAFESWLLRSHRRHDQEIMWGRALDDKNEEGAYTPGVDGQAHYTKYTKITRENMAFKKGDLIKIVRRQDKKTQVMAMGKIEGFRQSGHKSEGRLEGFVEIQKFAGLNAFESEFELFCLTTCDLHILKMTEEKTAREDIAKSIVTVAQVKCAHTIFSVGRNVDIEIMFYNCFCQRVENHTLNFEMLISQDDQPLLPSVSMSKINVGRNTFPTSIKKSGRYALSFNRLHVGETVIKIVDKEFKEFETITVYIQAGRAESLEFPPMLKTQLGFLIPDVIVKVLDEFGNKVAKSEIDQRNWQFLPSGSLKFSPHHLSKAIQTASQDGTITFSNLCLGNVPLGLSAQSSWKNIEFALQGIRISDKHACTAKFSMELSHGAPAVLEIRNLPATIQNDSVLEEISVSVSDVSQNLCNTATGTIIAVSGNLAYISPSCSLHDHHLLCHLPLLDSMRGKLDMKGRPVHNIMIKDPFAMKAVTSPADKTLELDLSQQHKVKSRLLDTNGETILVHDSLGVFVVGDFVMVDTTERTKPNSSKIFKFVREYDSVPARIDRMTCSSSNDQRQAGGVGKAERGTHGSNITLHVTMYENVFDVGDEVKAIALKYDPPWWDATVTRVFDDGTYEVKWVVDVKDDNGVVLEQTDVLKSGDQLRKKKTKAQDDRRRVKDSKVVMKISVRQIMSKAFVLDSAVLTDTSMTDAKEGGSAGLRDSLAMPIGTFASNVFFFVGEQNDFSMVLPVHIDFLFTEHVMDNGEKVNWYDCLDNDVKVLHHRACSRSVSSGIPKYMELYASDGSVRKMLQVSEIHYGSSGPITESYARDSEFHFSLRFRDESGALCRIPPVDPRNTLAVSCNWPKPEDGASSPLNDDYSYSLPAFTLLKSTLLEVMAVYARGHRANATQLGLKLPVQMQYGSPAKLCLQLVDKDHRLIRDIKVQSDCSLTIQILDFYNEQIPALSAYLFKPKLIYLRDSLGKTHTLRARQEDHQANTQHWPDVTQNSGHVFQTDKIKSIGDIFKLPFCRLGGKAGNVCLHMEAILVDSTGQVFEIASDALHLQLGAGDATKVTRIGETNDIFLASGVQVCETVTIEVAVTDDYENPVECSKAPKLIICG